MSSVSSPVHRYSSDYDNLLYETNFTADISNKMRVPSKILVTGEGKNNAVDLLPTKTSAEAEMWEKMPMTVPDRIIIAVDDENESDEGRKNNENPNRRIPMDPIIERNIQSNNPETSIGTYQDASMMSPTEVDNQMLKRHLAKLNRRVVLLEQESQLRQQREIIVFSLGITYFVLKVLRWLHQHW